MGRLYMNGEDARWGGLVWAGYVLLLLFSFSLYWSPLLWAGAAALVLGYYTRRKAARAESMVARAHAAWQINTVWLALLLALAGLAAVVGVAAWMGNNPVIMDRLDEIASGDLPPMDMLRQFWAVPGSKALIISMCCSVLLYLVWTFKRTLQGLMALWKGGAPTMPGATRWLALLLSVLLQAGILLLLI